MQTFLGFAEFSSEDLSKGRSWDGVDEFDDTDMFVTGNVVSYKRHDIIKRHCFFPKSRTQVALI